MKTLGEANKEREDIDEDTKAWVSKMRRNEEERKKAEKKVCAHSATDRHNVLKSLYS